MKKIFIIHICTVMILCNLIIGYSEEIAKIDGLHEKINSLFMINSFTNEEIQKMDEIFMEKISNDLLTRYLEAKKLIGKMETDSFEDEYELEMERAKLNYHNGVKVSLKKTSKYLREYAESDCLNYLFEGIDYWSVPTYKGEWNNGKFDMDGVDFFSISKYFGITAEWFNLSEDAMIFLRDETKIAELLIEKNVKKVNDIKIFNLDSVFSCIYFNCDNGEYIIKLFDSRLEYVPEIEYFKLYTAKEIMNAFYNLSNKEDYINGKHLAVYITQEKTSYEAEALALQSEGLLNGNEKGLDLLKPLTRIEAAAMLLRAMGETETADTQSVGFVDVPSTHWGYGAAMKAQELGIVNGVGNNSFAPDDRVTATQFATMVLRAANNTYFDWTTALDMIIEQGIITEENAKTMDLFTRGDMAKIIYEARAKGLF